MCGNPQDHQPIRTEPSNYPSMHCFIMINNHAMACVHTVCYSRTHLLIHGGESYCKSSRECTPVISALRSGNERTRDQSELSMRLYSLSSCTGKPITVKSYARCWRCSSVVGHLPTTCRALNVIPSMAKEQNQNKISSMLLP